MIYPGHWQTVMTGEDKRIRDLCIRQNYRNGIPIKEIAKRWHLAESTTRFIASQGLSRQNGDLVRNLAIYDARSSGATFTVIAREHQITRSRAQQIFNNVERRLRQATKRNIFTREIGPYAQALYGRVIEFSIGNDDPIIYHPDKAL